MNNANKMPASVNRHPSRCTDSMIQISAMTRNAIAMSTNQIRSTHGRRKRITAQCITVLLLLALAVPAFAQTTGTLIPNVPGEWQDNNGNPCSGCLMYSYLAGSTTLQSTYSDVALSVANANPVVLDSAGRATIFLSPLTYKFVLKSAAGVTIWTRDTIGANLSATGASSDSAPCDGRLTLTSATPITTADVTAATTIYWTPYKGSHCAVYDGITNTWTTTSFTELSISLGTDAASKPYDVFFYTSSGTPTIERVAWTNDTTRSTLLSSQNGVLVSASQTAKRYIGTYRTTTTIGQTEDSAAKRFVWNYYNRVRRTLTVTDTTDSWTYTTAAFRQANGAAANKVEVVVGVAEVAVTLTVASVATNTGTANAVTAIGLDSTTAVATGNRGMFATAQTGAQIQFWASLSTFPAIGYHYFAWLEYSTAAGTTTWYGDGGSGLIQSGLTGNIEG